MVPFVRVCFLVAVIGLAVPVGAQDKSEPLLHEAAGVEILEPIAQSIAPLAGELPEAPRRPAGLVPLYVSFASLQALDAHSTLRALNRGAVEVNPILRSIGANRAGMFAVKVAGTVGVIYASEKMWKKKKAAAIVFMVAANSALVWIVQHNYRAVR